VIQVDSFHPDTVVAATTNALLFRSTDGGDSWAHISFPAELRATLHAFAIAPNTGLYVVGLASETRNYSGIYLSADGGETWSPSPTIIGKSIWSIAIYPDDPRVMAAGAADGVYLTRDGGNHWARISPESNLALMPVVSVEFDPTDSRVIYVGTPHLPWKTTDGGATWKSAHRGMLDDSDVFSIHVDSSRPTRVFASACSGIYRSPDKANAWTKLVGARDASYRTYQITQHPTESNVLFAGTTHGLIRSTDAGATWRKLSSYTTRWVAFDAARPKRIYVATDEAGLLRSDDLGELLRPINKGFCNRHVVSMGALGATLYATTSEGFVKGGIFRRIKDSQRWETIDSDTPRHGQQILDISALEPNQLYVLTPRAILLSSDAGETWTKLPSPADSKLTGLVSVPGSGKLVLSTQTAIYFSENGGRSWQTSRMPQAQSQIRSLVALGSKSIAAITRSAILLSTDGSNYRATAPLDADSEIYGIIQADNADLLVATSYGLRRSADFGATWHPVPGVLDGNTVSAISNHPTRRGLLVASRYGTIFSSTDDGNTWRPITRKSLPPIRKLVIIPGISDTLFAITHAQGIFTVPLDSPLSLH